MWSGLEMREDNVMVLTLNEREEYGFTFNGQALVLSVIFAQTLSSDVGCRVPRKIHCVKTKIQKLVRKNDSLSASPSPYITFSMATKADIHGESHVYVIIVHQ
ncbi:unnamed protein product [Allacma fusca]|uniref:Uncharacterized protein n=1 Tax=Allacma fusca TaxID=39272 RepID=A0A8J2PD49_9HEXA|nr:unnamed protein product [Allacma fusca]